MKKELFLFVFLSVFIILVDLGAQIQGAQTQYTIVNFGLNQPLPDKLPEERSVQNLMLKWDGLDLSVSWMNIDIVGYICIDPYSGNKC